MRRFSKFILIFLAFLMLIPTAEIEAKTTYSIKLSGKSIVGKGQTITLKTTTSPKNAAVTWKSSNTSVATVSKNGVVTGVKVGTVTIKACLKDHKTICASKKIKVYPALTLSIPKKKIDVFEKVQINVTTNPKSLELTWKSSNPKVATVSAKKNSSKNTYYGVVQGASAGTSDITVCVKKYPKMCKTFTVTVKKSTSPTPTPTPKVTKVTVTGSKSTVAVKKTITLSASVTPSGASKTVYWQSDNTKIATVNNKGVVTGVKPGVTIIKACPTKNFNDSRCGEFSVTVEAAASGVTITDQDTGKKTIDLGTKGTSNEKLTYQLGASVSPEGANQKVTWSSSDKTIATVDANGLVTAKALGTVMIKATAADGTGANGSVTITVVSTPQKGYLKIKGTTTVGVGKKVTLTPDFSSQPVPPEDTSVTWTSNDEAIAKVSSKGVVTGVKEGSTGIKACSTVKPKVCKTVTLTVKAAAASIKINEGAKTIDIASGTKTVTYTATVDPSEASQDVTWSSSDESIATVSAKGVVTGKAVGTVTIKATTKDGTNKSASVKVTVKSTVQSGSLKVTGENTVVAEQTITLKAEFDQDPQPENTEVTWNSYNSSIAKVDDNGVVTGVKAGSTKIKVCSVEKTDECVDHAVTVTAKVTDIAVGIVSGSPNTGKVIDLASGSALYNLKASVTPAEAEQKVEWISSDESVATVDENGVVTGLAAGKVEITAKATDGSEVTSPAYEITVVSKVQAGRLKVTGEDTVVEGQTITLTATFDQDPQPGNTEVTWASYSSSTAKVDDNGVVTGVKAGSTKIKVCSVEKTDECVDHNVTVTAKVTEIGLSKADDESTTDKTIDIASDKKTFKLKVTVTPAEAEQKVEWISSDESVATVDDAGVVTGVAVGTVNITAKATDGSDVISNEYTLTITSKVQSGKTISVTGATEVVVGKTIELTATFDQDPQPENNAVTWTRSNSKADVDANGVVTGMNPGSSVITACSKEDTSVCGTLNIVVVAATSSSSVSVSPLSVKKAGAPKFVESISFDEGDTGTAAVGEEFTLHASVTPEEAPEPDLLWISLDETVATVDDGVVTPLKEGTAMLAAATTGENGEMVMQSYMLTVSAAPAAVKAEAAEPEAAAPEQASVDTAVSADTMAAPLAAAAPEASVEEQPAEAVKPSFAESEVTLKQAESVTLEVNNPDGLDVVVDIYGDKDSVMWDASNRVVTGVFPGEVTAYVASVDPFEVLDYMVVTVSDTPELAAVQAEEQQEVPAAEPAEVPYEEPEAEAIEPAAQVTEEPAAEPEAEPVVETVEEPAAAVVSEPAAVPAEEPAAETVVKPEDLVLPAFEMKEGAVIVGDRFELEVLYKEDEAEEYDEFEVIFEKNPEAVSWDKKEGIVTAVAAADVKIILKAGEPAEKFAEFLLHINPRPTEVPTAVPTEVPTEAPTEAPVEQPVEQPVEAPVEQPAEVIVEAPAEVTVEAPAEVTVEEPVEEIIEAPAEETVEEPVEETVEAAVEEPVEETVEESVEETAEAAVEEPVEETVEAAEG